ncbi:MAG: class I SAM-dependent methyltransferase [Candidatus Aenigmarchaeota archaeon]|nr:class I SAM-dependent methyltransferase [Candidatus Aenigmarchaeota archaeon]
MHHAKKLIGSLRERGASATARKIAFKACRRFENLLLGNPVVSRFFSRQFQKIYYNSFASEDAGAIKFTWFGTRIGKLPFDLMMYQEIIHETDPDYIIETGTNYGGSALFFATLFDSRKKGKVITVDISDRYKVSHPRITKLTGFSTDPKIVEEIGRMVKGKRVLVSLDSDHSKENVLKEMYAYEKFVKKGGYMVVEDTNINGHPVAPFWGPGPMEAVNEFLKHNSDFVIDKSKERNMMTFFPNGYLKRVK